MHTPCFCANFITSAAYITNSRGPKTEPCGTLHISFTGDDVLPSKLTSCVLPVTNEVSHLSTVSLSLYDVSRRRSRISKSTVSKAALMSKRPSSVVFCESVASRISDSTFNVAVSVECPGRYADCNGGIKLDSVRNVFICYATIRSITFEIKVRFEIGRYEQ